MKRKLRMPEEATECCRLLSVFLCLLSDGVTENIVAVRK